MYESNTATTLLSAGTDSIMFDFLAGSNDSAWIIQYDTTGFTLGSGVSFNANNDTIVINGLGPDTTYDIYVKCVRNYTHISLKKGEMASLMLSRDAGPDSVHLLTYLPRSRLTTST